MDLTSIPLDVIMFNSREEIVQMHDEYTTE